MLGCGRHVAQGTSQFVGQRAGPVLGDAYRAFVELPVDQSRLRLFRQEGPITSPIIWAQAIPSGALLPVLAVAGLCQYSTDWRKARLHRSRVHCSKASQSTNAPRPSSKVVRTIRPAGRRQRPNGMACIPNDTGLRSRQDTTRAERAPCLGAPLPGGVGSEIVGGALAPGRDLVGVDAEQGAVEGTRVARVLSHRVAEEGIGQQPGVLGADGVPEQGLEGGQ